MDRSDCGLSAKSIDGASAFSYFKNNLPVSKLLTYECLENAKIKLNKPFAQDDEQTSASCA